MSEQPDAVVWGADVKHVSQVDPVSQVDSSIPPTLPSRTKVPTGREGGTVQDGLGPEGHVVVELSDGRKFDGHCCLASDGIYSKTRELILSREAAPLRYLGYIVVLGIFKNSKHDLCKSRMFQTSDGRARMFAMPFSKHQSMWQLSWEMEEAEARQLARSPDLLREAALQTCRNWHAPIPSIIAASDFEQV